VTDIIPQEEPNTSEGVREWEDWLREYAPRILLFARQQSRNAEDAEDIVQEALIKLAKKEASGEFVGGQAGWLPFVYATIRRIAIDFGRRNDRRVRREEAKMEEDALEMTTVQDPWFDSEAGEEELKDLVEGQLKKLPSKFSEVIVLKIWGEQSFKEIAESLGISLNTVASRYRYGLQQLKRAISNKRDEYGH
jgi:RNA polymerase sigma-70 factor (ECF subfamily)